MMESHYPVWVAPLENYRLALIFDNNRRGIFDLSSYLSDPYFSRLKDKNLFRSVKVNPLTVEWANGIDLCPDELYANAIPIDDGHLTAEEIAVVEGEK